MHGKWLIVLRKLAYAAAVLSVFSAEAYADFDEGLLQQDTNSCYQALVKHHDSIAGSHLQKSYSYEFLCQHYGANPRKPFKTERFKCFLDANNFVLTGDSTAVASSPYRTFAIMRTSVDTPYSITYMSQISRTPREKSEIEKDEQHAQLGYPGFLMRHYDARMRFGQLNSFSGDGFRCTRIIPVTAGLYRLEFVNNNTPKPDQVALKSGYVIIDKSKDFAVVEHEVIFSYAATSIKQRSVIDYYPLEEALPHTVKSLRWTESRGSVSAYDIDFSFPNFSLAPFPKEMLTLEYYGVVDPLQSDAWPIWPYILIGVGIVGVGVGVYLWLRRRSRTH